MKKILIVTDNLPDQINGVVTTFKNIEQYALADGYELVYLDPRSFPHINCPGYPEVKLSLPWRIGTKIKDINPDHIHIATEGPLGCAANVWGWICKWKYNTSYHTKFPEFLKEMYNIPMFLTYMYLRWFHNHSGVVLTTTKTMVDLLKEQKFKRNVVPWTRGVNRENLAPTENGTLHMQAVVLYVGRVSKEKNLDDLCVLQDKFSIQIVGDGPDRKRLEEKYPKVRFLGYRAGSDLANCYANADVFCFPSISDTFGIVIIESLSLGTPVAAYPVAGPIDILEQGINGYMSDNLELAIRQAIMLDRDIVKASSEKWTWQECWNIFRSFLVDL